MCVIGVNTGPSLACARNRGSIQFPALRVVAEFVHGEQIHFDESVTASATPPRSAEFLLLCLLPRKNRYLMGCLEEKFQTLLLPKYGRFYANVYYWSQALQSLAWVAWGLFKKMASLTALWRLFR